MGGSLVLRFVEVFVLVSTAVQIRAQFQRPTNYVMLGEQARFMDEVLPAQGSLPTLLPTQLLRLPARPMRITPPTWITRLFLSPGQIVGRSLTAPTPRMPPAQPVAPTEPDRAMPPALLTAPTAPDREMPPALPTAPMAPNRPTPPAQSTPPIQTPPVSSTRSMPPAASIRPHADLEARYIESLQERRCDQFGNCPTLQHSPCLYCAGPASTSDWCRFNC